MLPFLILFLINFSCYCVGFQQLGQQTFRHNSVSNSNKLKCLGEQDHSSDSSELPKISRDSQGGTGNENIDKEKPTTAPFKKNLRNALELQSDETFQKKELKKESDVDKDDSDESANMEPKPDSSKLKKQQFLEKKKQFTVIKIDPLMPDMADFELEEDHEKSPKIGSNRVRWFFNQIDWEPFEFSKET